MNDQNVRRVTIQDRVFGPEDVVTIDGHDFLNCFFGACTIIYSGGEFGMKNTSTDGSFRLELRDAAARTGQLLQWMKIDIREYAPAPPYDPIQ
jgi:limonene-1,2-epoxide hydrolase